MGDFPPPQPTSVKASELIHRAVDKSYEDFRSVMFQLPNMREDERREPLLKYLLETRKRFAQLLAALKWSVQSPLLEQCRDLLQQADQFRNQINESNDRMFFMHADLNRAKERRYDLSTAVDVLYGGSYLRFPAVAKNAMYPRELPPVDPIAAASEINDIIRFRLIEADIPEQFTNIQLEDGFVRLEAEGEFEMVLTILSKDNDSPWRVISVSTALADPKSFDLHAKATPTSSLRIIKNITPTAAHYVHLRNLVQRAMTKSQKPFVDAFRVMREFCSSLALQILFSQGKLLMEGRWKNKILVKYHRDENVVDFCYWPTSCVKKKIDPNDDRHRLLAQMKNSLCQAGGILPPALPETSLCIRLSVDPEQKKMLHVSMNPHLPPDLKGKQDLLRDMEVPSNMFLLSAENLLLGAMRAHVASTLFALGRQLVVGSTPQPIVVHDFNHAMLSADMTASLVKTQLVSGESVLLGQSNTSLRLARCDIGGLQHFLEITFDIREGKFVAKCVATAKSAMLSNAIKNLERSLNTHCKIEITSVPEEEFSLSCGEIENIKARQLVHESVHRALCEVVAYEIAQIGNSLKGIEVVRNVSLSWDRYISFRQQHGGQTEDLTISDSALYFQLTTSKESTCYLVIEIDKYAEVDVGVSGVPGDEEESENYVRLPCFSLLQTSTSGSTSTNATAGVQFIQRFPAFKGGDFHPALRDSEKIIWKGKKRTSFEELESGCSNKKPNNRQLSLKQSEFHLTPTISSVLLHVINICSERIQLQHFVNFARRRKSRIRYSGEAGTKRGEGTGGQVVTLSFPDKVNADPLKIVAIQGHLKHGGGFDLCLQMARPPFTFILPKDPSTTYLSTLGHHVNKDGALIFQYPSSSTSSSSVSGAAVGDMLNENPLEVFMVELICVVKPLCELAVKLENIMKAVGRYTNEIKDDGHFYVESADPFAIVLACRTKNPRKTLAGGSSVDNMVTYRVTIQFKQKMGFVVNYSHKAEHPLMHFIQSALNGHNDPGELLEALERTVIPMGMLASVVESQLFCAKYYRQESAPSPKEAAGTSGASAGKMFGFSGNKGGKGMKLGYKCKLPGEEKGYYAEKSYGGDDKSFIPAELVMIPRSQTHARLSYGDRCAVDIYFLEVRLSLVHNMSLDLISLSLIISHIES
jgi:hypothetical protein